MELQGNLDVAGTITATSLSGSATAVGGVTVSGTPSSGQVLTATSSSAADWQTPSGNTFVEGAVLASYPLPFSQAGYATFDGVNMWVAGGGSGGTICKVAPDGTVLQTISAGSYINKGAFDGTNFWIPGNNAGGIFKINPQGTISSYYIPGSNPYFCAFDGTNMWVTCYTTAEVVKVTPDGNAVAYSGVTGGANPYDIAFDGTNMWVVNSGDNPGSISIISPQGSLISTVVVSGTTNLGNICFDGTNMWVADGAGNTVGAGSFTPINITSLTQGASIGGLTSPEGMCFDGENIWGVCASNGDIIKISPSGSSTLYPAVIPAGGSLAIFAPTFDGQNIWIPQYNNAGNSNLYKIAALPQLRSASNQPSSLVGFALAAGASRLYASPEVGSILASYPTPTSYNYVVCFDGTNMWVSSSDGTSTLTVVSPDGRIVRTFSGFAVDYLGSLAFDGKDMWLASGSSSNVFRFNLSGGLVANYVTSIGNPWGLAFDGTNMWCTDYFGANIIKIDPSGNIYSFAGAGGVATQVPAFDGINMWTADGNSATVSKFAPDGSFTSYPITAIAYSIAFDGLNMWTANYGDGSISKISPLGAETNYPLGIPNPVNIKFDGESMWITSGSSGSLYKVNLDGTFSSYIGFPNSCAYSCSDGLNLWVTTGPSNTLLKVKNHDTYHLSGLPYDVYGFARFNGNKTPASSFVVVALDPSSPSAGQVWFNTTDGQFKGYNGSAVVILG